MSLLILFGAGAPPSADLTTFADNRSPVGGFFESEIMEVCRDNAAAIVLGATGAAHTADLAVSAGHKHDSTDTRLAWKQIATHLLGPSSASVGAFGTAPDETVDAVIIDSATTADFAVLRLWLTATEVADVIPRVRVSNDNSATTNCNIYFDFYESDGTTAIASYTLTFSTATARDRVWVNGVTQDLSAATADADVSTRYPVLVFVSADLDAATEPVALHEISFGVTP